MVKEHSSQCNSDQLVVTHNVLDLDVDFDAKTISGSVEVGHSTQRAMKTSALSPDLHLFYEGATCISFSAPQHAERSCGAAQVTAKAVQDAAAELVLDTSSITVHEVSLKGGGSEAASAVAYKLAPRHKACTNASLCPAVPRCGLADCAIAKRVMIAVAVLHHGWSAAGARLAAGHQLAHAAVEGRQRDGQHLVRFRTACAAGSCVLYLLPTVFITTLMQVHDVARSISVAVAGAFADGWPEAAVPVHAVPGHPCTVAGPLSGAACCRGLIVLLFECRQPSMPAFITESSMSLCRSAMQDTPSVKSTYSAVVRVPAEHVALMSAIPTEDKEGAQDAPAGKKVFRFNQVPAS